MIVRAKSIRRKHYVISTAALAAVGLFWGSTAQAGTSTWTTGAGPGNGNWSSGGNWTPSVPANADTLVFGNTLNPTTTNDLGALTSVAGITFNGATSGQNAYTINGTSALTLTGTLTDTVGGAATPITQTFNMTIAGTTASSLVLASALGTGGVGLTFNANATFGSLSNVTSANTDFVTISAGNTLTLNGTTANTINIGTGGAAATTNINMGGGSGNFTASGTTANIYAGTSQSGTFTLSNGTNTFTYTTINLSTSGSANSGTGTLKLGGGSNIFHLAAGAFNIGQGKSAGVLNFAGSGGSVTIDGGAGAVPNIVIGRFSSATATNTTNQLNVASHTANISAGSVIVGQQNGSTGGGTGGSSVSFDTGTFTANSITLALDSSGTNTNGAKGVFNLGTNSSSTGVLNATTFTMGSVASGSSTTARTNTSTFNINGGTANIGSNIAIDNTGTRNVSASAAITLQGGTLNMGFGGTAHSIGTIGTSATFTNAFTFTMPTVGNTATLQTLGGLGIVANGGTGQTSASGGLAMGGLGTLILGGTNTYTGPTSVTAGVLRVDGTTVSSSAFTVSGGQLGGIGTIGGAVTVSGGQITGSTGAAPSGILTLANGLSVSSGTLLFNIGTSTSNSINVTGGTATFTGGSLSYILGGSPTPGSIFHVVTTTSPLSTGGLILTPQTIGRTTFTPSALGNDLIVTTGGGPATIIWNDLGGSPADGVTWDTQNNQNWSSATGNNGSGGANGSDFFYANDNVVFNDNNNLANNANAYGPVHITGSVTPGSVTVNNSAGDYTFDTGTIDGTGGLVKQGSRTLDLTPITNSSYSGVTQISGTGTLKVSVLANGGVNSSIGAASSAASNLVLDGGTLQWAGGASQTTARGVTVTTNGGTLNASPTGTFALTLSGPLVMSGSGTRALTLSGNDTTLTGQVLSSVISDGAGGATSVVKNGNNSWTLSAANLYSGGTTVTSGRIRATNAAAFGTAGVSVSSGGQVFLNTGSTFTNSFSIAGIGVAESGVPVNAGALRLGSNSVITSGTITLTGPARITARGATTGGTVTGQITGNQALELGNGGGTAASILTLSNTSNNWNGATTISLGTVKPGASSSATGGVIPHGSGAGDVTINGVTQDANNGGASSLDLNGFNVTVNGLNSSGDLSQVVVTNSVAGTGTLSIGDNNASSSYAGTIINNAGISKIGTGTLVLSGNNTHTGGNTVNAGTLRMENANALGSTSNSLAVNGGTLDLNNNSLQVGNLAGTGGVITTNVSGTINLTANVTGNTTFSGAMQNGSGQISFTKQGSGTLTLAGANVHTGDTNIENGALIVNGSLASGGNVNVNNVGTLGGSGTVGAVSLNSDNVSTNPGATIGAVGTLGMQSLQVGGGRLKFDFDGLGNNDLVTVSAAATFNNNSVLTLLSTGVITAGTYTLLTSGNLTINTLPKVASTYRQSLSLSTAANSLSVTVGAATSATLTWSGNISNNWDVAATQNWVNAGNPDFYAQGDTLIFNDTNSTYSVQLDTAVTPASITVINSNNDYTISGSGSIGGGTGITKQGTAVLNLNITGGLTYSGTTAIQNGTLKLGTGTLLPTTGTVLLGNGTTSGTLDINGNNVTVGGLGTSGSGTANTITNNGANAALTVGSGSSNFGGIIQNGSGTTSLAVNAASLTLTGANIYTGTTTVTNGGTLTVNAGGTLGNGSAVIIGTGTTLGTINANTDVTVGSLVSAANNSNASTLAIGSGKTFSVSGNVRVGIGTATDFGVTQLAVSGGAFAAGTGSGTFVVSNEAGAGGNGGTSVLDASGASSFLANYGSSGLIILGANATGGATVVSPGNRGHGALILPTSLSSTSILTAGTLTLGNDSTNQGIAASTLTLGQDTTIKVNAIADGVQKGSGTIIFGTGLTNPIVRINDVSGTGRVATVKVADFSPFTSSSNTNPTGIIDLSGGTANVMIDVLTLGIARLQSTGTGTPTVNFTFANGSADINSIVVGSRGSATQTTAGATGTLTVGSGSGTLTVNAGGIKLGDSNGAVANAAQYVGTFNANGATTVLGADIIDGGGSSTLTVNGGTIDMQNHNIGGANPIDTLNFQSGTLKNVAQINNGAGLTKTTAGTLNMDGTNTYTGPTNVNGGVLVYKTTYTTGSAVNITNAATVQLATSISNNVVLRTPSLSITGIGTLDLMNNKLIVPLGTLSTIEGMVNSGAIMTSSATSVAGVPLTTVGVALAGDIGKGTHGGVGVTGTDVLAMYTFAGDANLTGTINGDDYFRIDSHYAGTAGFTAVAYENGDFDHNSVIDGDDYFLIDTNYVHQANAPAIQPGSGLQGGSGLGGGVSTVPEPGSLGLIAAAALGAMRRRRRK